MTATEQIADKLRYIIEDDVRVTWDQLFMEQKQRYLEMARSLERGLSAEGLWIVRFGPDV